MKKKISLAICFFIALCFCVSVANVSNAFMFDEYQTLYGYLDLKENTTSRIEVVSFPYLRGISEVIFEPRKSGTWKLNLIGESPFWYKKASGAVQVAWKDYKGDNKWHVFTEQNVGFGFYTNIILYSGSPSISYRIRFADQCDMPGFIRAKPIFLY